MSNEGTTPEQGANETAEITARKVRGLEIMEQLTGNADAMSELLTGLSPDYVSWVTEFALGQVWARPGLDLKTRSLCTVAALTVLGRTNNLKTHIRGAVGNGATREEIIETILHMTVYGGFPDSWDGLAAAREVFAALDAETPADLSPDAAELTEDGEGFEKTTDVGPVG